MGGICFQKAKPSMICNKYNQLQTLEMISAQFTYSKISNNNNKVEANYKLFEKILLVASWYSLWRSPPKSFVYVYKVKCFTFLAMLLTTFSRITPSLQSLKETNSFCLSHLIFCNFAQLVNVTLQKCLK